MASLPRTGSTRCLSAAGAADARAARVALQPGRSHLRRGRRRTAGHRGGRPRRAGLGSRRRRRDLAALVHRSRTAPAPAPERTHARAADRGRPCRRWPARMRAQPAGAAPQPRGAGQRTPGRARRCHRRAAQALPSPGARGGRDPRRTPCEAHADAVAGPRRRRSSWHAHRDPLAYPGDDASPRALAAWMAAHAARAGLPPELPVMAALTESGLRNLSYGDRDSVGLLSDADRHLGPRAPTPATRTTRPAAALVHRPGAGRARGARRRSGLRPPSVELGRVGRRRRAARGRPTAAAIRPSCTPPRTSWPGPICTPAPTAGHLAGPGRAARGRALPGHARMTGAAPSPRTGL